MSRLNAAEIQAALHVGEVLVFEEIPSTNAYLLDAADRLPQGTVCFAESQTAGRGRRGRQWYSPQGNNLYFSMLWRYSEASQKLSSLSLVVALVIAETFTELGVEGIQIKWPNDIYYQGKKAGGILIESKIDQNSVALVIGIGLNLAMQEVDTAIVTQAWADLGAYRLDRNRLAAQLSRHLQQMLSAFPEAALPTYWQRWQTFDCFYRQEVKLITPQEVICGISQGINENGELLLAREGRVEAYAIGEISLRPQE